MDPVPYQTVHQSQIIRTAAAQPLAARIQSLCPQLAQAAQEVYDAWVVDEDGDDDYGGGGICDAVANAMHGVLAMAGLEVQEGGHEGDDHAWLVVTDDATREAVSVDIPARVYETGGGYNWTKIPDVVIGADDVIVEPIRDPPDELFTREAAKRPPRGLQIESLGAGTYVARLGDSEVGRANVAAAGTTKLVGYHFSATRFDSVDPTKFSETAILGPGLYLSSTRNVEAWSKNRAEPGYIYTFEVTTAPDRILDGPITDAQWAKVEAGVGQEIDHDAALLPILRKKFGSVNAGWRACGFDVIIHQRNNASPHEFLVLNTDSARIVDVEPLARTAAGRVVRMGMGRQRTAAVTQEEMIQLQQDADESGKHQRRDFHDWPSRVPATSFVEFDAPVSALDVAGVNEELAAQYAAQPGEFPPIYVRYGARAAKKGWDKLYVVNGNHRALAAQLRGDVTIRALIAVEDQERWRLRREAASQLVPPERADYIAGILASVGSGPPGISVKERDFGMPPRHSMPGFEIVYRTKDGVPISAARVVAGKVTALVTDKSRGVLAARAAVAVMRELQKLGFTEPSSTYTPDAKRVMDRATKKSSVLAAIIDEREAAARKPKAPPPPVPLVAMHNLSTENLLHAEEVGGLVAPSIAITKPEHVFDSFGEITLLAPKAMVDPTTTPVFDADVYSPRYPTVRYKPNSKALDKIRQTYKEHAERTESYWGDAEDKVKNEGHEGLLRRMGPALQLAFLEQKGVQVPAPTRNKPLEVEWAQAPTMQQFFSEHGYDRNARPGDSYWASLSEAAKKAVEEYWRGGHASEGLDDADRKHLIETSMEHHFSEGALDFNRGDKLFRSHQNIGQTETDQYAYRDQLAEAIKPYAEEFDAWAREQLRPTQGDPYLTSDGGKKMPYNPDNVLKLMTKRLKGGEGFNYGPGSTRALGATKFKSFQQMEDRARTQIVSHDEFDKAKKENTDAYFALVEKLAPYHPASGSFGFAETLLSSIGESFKRGRSLPAELRRDGFQGVPPDLIQEITKYRDALVNMPTEYFEAKPQRLVPLNEFVGAAVPVGASPQVLAVLQANGLPVAYYDKDKPETRAQAVAQLQSNSKVAAYDGAGKTAALFEPPPAMVESVYRSFENVLVGWMKTRAAYTKFGAFLDERYPDVAPRKIARARFSVPIDLTGWPYAERAAEGRKIVWKKIDVEVLPETTSDDVPEGEHGTWTDSSRKMTLNVKWLPQYVEGFEQLLAENKRTIEHELQHLGQMLLSYAVASPAGRPVPTTWEEATGRLRNKGPYESRAHEFYPLLRGAVDDYKSGSYASPQEYIEKSPWFSALKDQSPELWQKAVKIFTQSVDGKVAAYGGPGPLELPEDHEAGMEVPKGGSSCANCAFLREDDEHCGNSHWVKWNGGDDALPAPADEYCCDFYQPASTRKVASVRMGMGMKCAAGELIERTLDELSGGDRILRQQLEALAQKLLGMDYEEDEVVQELRQRKTPAQRKQQPDVPGAQIVGHVRDHTVYKVDTFAAAQALGTKNWCVVRDQKHWDSYKDEGVAFYFYVPASGPPAEYATAMMPSGTSESYDFNDEMCPAFQHDLDKTTAPLSDAARKNTRLIREQEALMATASVYRAASMLTGNHRNWDGEILDKTSALQLLPAAMSRADFPKVFDAIKDFSSYPQNIIDGMLALEPRFPELVHQLLPHYFVKAVTVEDIELTDFGASWNDSTKLMNGGSGYAEFTVELSTGESVKVPVHFGFSGGLDLMRVDTASVREWTGPTWLRLDDNSKKHDAVDNIEYNVAHEDGQGMLGNALDQWSAEQDLEVTASAQSDKARKRTAAMTHRSRCEVAHPQQSHTAWLRAYARTAAGPELGDPTPVTQGLYPYLKDKAFDTARTWQSMAAALGRSRWAALLSAVGTTPQKFEAMAEDADNEFYDLCTRIDASLTAEDREKTLNFMHRYEPAEAPSWAYLESPKLVRPDTWLIHFTDDARSVQSEGFTRGIADVSQLGLTRHMSDADKEYGGYAFAFVANSGDALNAGTKYGSEAVMFRAVGVRAYHNGDNEHQVIFWGESVKPSGIVALTKDRNTDEYCVATRGRMNNRGRDCAFKGPLAKAVAWVEANYNQYRSQITAAAMRDVVVSIPKDRLAEVEAEEAAVAQRLAAGEIDIAYYWQMGQLPKEQPGRIFFAWDGAVRAFHQVTGMERNEAGRGGRIYMDPTIHEVAAEPMPAFRGFRYRQAADMIPGGRADNIPPEDFDADAVEEGAQHELEHTDDDDLAKEIARDHLAEDPDYYVKLKQVEARAARKTAQYDSVVFHGSRTPGLTYLESGDPPYAGGIGAGVYVAFDQDVAAFYGPYLYKLKLNIPEASIFWLTPDTIDTSINTYLHDSVLQSENVAPFSFDLNGQRYSVVAGEGGADDNEYISLIAGGMVEEALANIATPEARWFVDTVRRRGNAADAYYLEDDFLDWLAQHSGVEDDVQLRQLAAPILDAYQRSVDNAEERARKLLGLAISMDQIGNEVSHAGYRAVYLEGVRGNMPDSELLVFDPDDLEVIGSEERKASVQNVHATFRPLKVEAQTNRAHEGFWISPEGQSYSVMQEHAPWALRHLTEQNIPLKPRGDLAPEQAALQQLLEMGWIRVSGPTGVNALPSAGYDRVLAVVRENSKDLNVGDVIYVSTTLDYTRTVGLRVVQPGRLNSQDLAQLRGFLKGAAAAQSAQAKTRAAKRAAAVPYEDVLAHFDRYNPEKTTGYDTPRISWAALKWEGPVDFDVHDPRLESGGETGYANMSDERAIIEGYAERARNGSPMPPIILTETRDGELGISDGSHRLEAARLAGLKTIPAYVGRRNQRTAEAFDLCVCGHAASEHDLGETRPCACDEGCPCENYHRIAEGSSQRKSKEAAAVPDVPPAMMSAAYEAMIAHLQTRAYYMVELQKEQVETPRRASMRTAARVLYRAQDPSNPYSGQGSWWAESLEDAEAYTDNPGFGGSQIVSTPAAGRILDLATDSAHADADVWDTLEPLLDGDPKFDKMIMDLDNASLEDLGTGRALEEHNSNSDWQYTHDVVSSFAEKLAQSYDWVVVTDSFPAGARTWLYLGAQQLRTSIEKQGRASVRTAARVWAFLREKDTAGSKAGVFLRIPEPLASAFPVQRGDDESPAHFTVAYVLGRHESDDGKTVVRGKPTDDNPDMPPLNDADREDLIAAVELGMGDFQPFAIKLNNGIEWFENGKGEQIAHKEPAKGTTGEEQLQALAKRVRDALGAEGFVVSFADKPFLAHATLAYCDKQEYDGDVPEGRFPVKSLELWGWPDTYVFDLGQVGESDSMDKAAQAGGDRAMPPGFDAFDVFDESEIAAPKGPPPASELQVGDRFTVEGSSLVWEVVKTNGSGGYVKNVAHVRKWFGYSHGRDTNEVEVYPIMQGSGDRTGPALAFGILQRLEKTARAYHGTPNRYVKLDPNVSGLGTHFGTEAAAKERGHYKNRGHDQTWQVHAYDLDIKNPLRVEDAGLWHNQSEVIRALDAAGALQPAERARLLADDPKKKYDDTWREMRAIIESKGYDSVVYKNKAESEGEDSYVVWNDALIHRQGHEDAMPTDPTGRVGGAKDWLAGAALGLGVMTTTPALAEQPGPAQVQRQQPDHRQHDEAKKFFDQGMEEWMYSQRKNGTRLRNATLHFDAMTPRNEEEPGPYLDTPAPEPKREKVTPSEIGVAPGAGLANIMGVLNAATPEERGYWGHWYHTAAGIVSQMAEKYALPVERVAGVVAVMSPGNRWGQNVVVAKQIIEWWLTRQKVGPFAVPEYSGVGGFDIGAQKSPEKKRKPYDFTPRKVQPKGEPATLFEEKGPKQHPLGLFGPKPSGYPRNVQKAVAILEGADPRQVVTGPKVTVFFESLLDPAGFENMLVLDGHAINIWRGTKRSLKGIEEPSKDERALMEADYEKAAEAAGLSVQAVQAITWFIWKSTKASKTAAMRLPDAAYEILDAAAPGSTFGSGGCWILAEALREVRGGEVYVVTDERNVPQHFVLKTGNRYVDVDGSWSADELLSQVRRYSNVKNPKLAHWAGGSAGEIPVDAKAASDLAVVLRGVTKRVAEYGGPGLLVLPDDHVAGMVVPRGGSSCASCTHMSDEGGGEGEPAVCGNEAWVAWNGSEAIPVDPEEYCCDWYGAPEEVVEEQKALAEEKTEELSDADADADADEDVERVAAWKRGASGGRRRRKKLRDRRRRMTRAVWYLRADSDVAFTAAYGTASDFEGVEAIVLKPGAKVLRMTEDELMKRTAKEKDPEVEELIAMVKAQMEVIENLTASIDKLLEVNKSGYDAVQTEDRLVILNKDSIERLPKKQTWMTTLRPAPAIQHG